MTRTMYRLSDIGGALDWASLRIFVYGLMRDRTSLTWREINDPDDELSGWLDGSRVAPVLADLFDLLASTRHAMVQMKSKRRIKRPKPYPRPWVKDGKKHIGSSPIRIDEFESWWDEQE